jgi:Zn-dependent peptidase ImmA (M78 family)
MPPQLVSRTRLRVARECRGFTRKELADLLHISPASMTCFEYGSRNAFSHLEEISSVLDFPQSFFLADDLEELPNEAITFRSRASLTSRVRDKVVARSRLASSLISKQLRSRFALPTLDLPDLAGHEPEVAAMMLRDHWQIGSRPILNLVHLLEAKGVEVYWIEEKCRCVDAFSYMRCPQAFVFLNTYKPAGERGRFDAAHELAHLVLHRSILPQLLDTREIEAEADRFASAFLVPKDEFLTHAPRVPIFTDLLEMKQQWGISLQALVRRGKDIGLYSPTMYDTANKEISRRQWRTREPAEFLREASSIHQKVFVSLARKNVSPVDFANEISIRPADLFELMPTAQTYMRDPKYWHLHLVSE